MPRRDSYAPGTPCWIDRISARLPEVQDFYTALFGWTYAEDGGYRTAMQGGEIVAGFGSAATPREFWSVYLAAKDLDAVARDIVPLGGRVVLPRMQIGEVGALLLALDPAGALVGFWAGQRAEGVVLVDEPGTACRFQLRVPALAAVETFYGTLCGLRAGSRDGRPTLDLPDGPAVDVVEDPSAPPAWQVHFGVADLVASLGTALSRGARAAGTPADGSVTLVDPWGARFGLQQLA